MVKKILYIHGYNGSPTGGSYTLFDELLDKQSYELHTIDYDYTDPEGAIKSVKEYIRKHKIDIVIGSSLGGFITLFLYGVMRIVINPCWNPAVELPLVGYTGPTAVYESLLRRLIDTTDEEEAELCCGCFAPADELLGEKYRETFSHYYRRVYDIPGGHRVSCEAVEKIINEVIPEHDAESDDYVRKLLAADNLPMWND